MSGLPYLTYRLLWLPATFFTVTLHPVWRRSRSPARTPGLACPAAASAGCAQQQQREGPGDGGAGRGGAWPDWPMAVLSPGAEITRPVRGNFLLRRAVEGNFTSGKRPEGLERGERESVLELRGRINSSGKGWSMAALKSLEHTFVSPGWSGLMRNRPQSQRPPHLIRRE